MCIHSPESQPYPGLHQEKLSQQVEGGNSASLLCCGKTPPGVLHLALETPAKERHGPVGTGPEEGHKDGPRAGVPYRSLSVPEGGPIGKKGKIFSTGFFAIGQAAMVLN